jgi:hypothetical protein
MICSDKPISDLVFSDRLALEIAEDFRQLRKRIYIGY